MPTGSHKFEVKIFIFVCYIYNTDLVNKATEQAVYKFTFRLFCNFICQRNVKNVTYENKKLIVILRGAGGAKRRYEHLTIRDKLTKPTNSVAGVEEGKGKREREGKTARGEEGGGARPTQIPEPPSSLPEVFPSLPSSIHKNKLK